MYKILLCCASGLTTSMLVNSMKSEAEQQNIDSMIWAVAETAINLSWSDADCLLVAPQCAGSYNKIVEMVNNTIPVATIDGDDFSKMNGQAVLKQALDLINS